ncbi:copper resistance protein B [Curvivirga sp.]|uniref:copper resistance protein B n=1 Tax=Curvivirga sp. TaxID=2856848 RepID=UPI003B5C22CD
MKYQNNILGACILGATLVSITPAYAEIEAETYYGAQVEEAEYRFGDEGERLFVWNTDVFYGTDELKLRWLSEGEIDTNDGIQEGLENRVVLQTPISDFFDAKVGLRADTPEGEDRYYGVLGVTGLAPQWFEVDADFFLSEKGDTSVRLDVEYELLLTNRLILTPSLDVDFAFSDDEEVGVGSGLSSSELGLRLSYDVIDRSFSPYVGVVHERKYGNTKDLALDEGEDSEAWALVFGSRFVF